MGAALVFAVAATTLGAAADSADARAAGAGYFSDDEGSVHEPALDALAALDVLAGLECGDGLICPEEPLKRWEMAVWLVRVLDGTDPAAFEAERFADVDYDAWWAPSVERLFDLGVTVGCRRDPLQYCPGSSVSRAQMATFLTRAFDLDPAPSAGFADVSGGSHEAGIDALAAAGVTVGCRRDPLRYCPDRDVNRAHMASFLARALELVELPPEVRFTAVDVSAFHACGIRVDGTVECWGANEFGQSDAPRGQFSAVSVGLDYSCGLHTDGTVQCWGRNYNKQKDVPGSRFKAISAGANRPCGIRTDGTVECWGNDPDHTQAPDGEFEAVAAGWNDSGGSGHSCALRTDKTITCWGQRTFGAADAPSGQYGAVTVGRDHSCAVRTDKTIACWGQRMLGATDAPGGHFTALDSGARHSCGLRIDRTITCWGFDTWGEAQAPTGIFSSVSAGTLRACGVRLNGAVACWGAVFASPAAALSGPFTAVSASPDHACGLRADHTVECWGTNYRGRATPLVGRHTKMDTGTRHSCGLRIDRTITCWGDSRYRRTDAPEGQFVDVAVGEHQSCGIRVDGTVACWGSGADKAARTLRGRFNAIDGGTEAMCGVRADLSVECWAVAPELADTPRGDFSAVSAGDRHACGLRIDGSVVCWGDNTHGQSDAPDGDFSAVSAGDRHACGLRIDGSVVCWGDNADGQSDALDGHFQAVSASRSYTCGLDVGDRIRCWGDAGRVPMPVGVLRATGPGHPDPRECRPFAHGLLAPGFPVDREVPTSGTLNVAVLFVDFRDAPALNTAQQESLKGLAYVEKYLESASYGKLRIEFVPLYRWLRSGRSHKHYLQLAPGGPPQRHTGISREAVELADPDFDFSRIDAVMTVMPSARFAGGNATGYVETEEGPVSSLRVNAAYGYSTTNWGPVAAHELAHNLGLADLYPYTANQHFQPLVPPVGKRWRQVELGLMSLRASIPVDDRDPRGHTVAPEMLAWSRWQLGWLDAGQVHCVDEEQATVELSPVADPGDGIAMAALPLSTDEMLVLESRRNIGYDERAALGGGGVLVYTVDAGIRSGDLPTRVAGDAGRGHTDVNPILVEGDSITIRGYTITVIADDGDTHTVTIAKADDG